MRHQQQQGDVLILKINALPQELKRVQPIGGRLILARGEATGHAHAILDQPGIELYEDTEGRLYLKVDQETMLVHEEHEAQTIEPGIFEIGPVVEIDPFADEIRKVTD